jgi:hypothetical protein
MPPAPCVRMAHWDERRFGAPPHRRRHSDHRRIMKAICLPSGENRGKSSRPSSGDALAAACETVQRSYEEGNLANVGNRSNRASSQRTDAGTHNKTTRANPIRFNVVLPFVMWISPLGQRLYGDVNVTESSGWSISAFELLEKCSESPIGAIPDPRCGEFPPNRRWPAVGTSRPVGNGTPL